eukprot:9268343-Alexandrium_andersonii.AAC.1
MSGTERQTSARRAAPRHSPDQRNRLLDCAVESRRDAAERDDEDPVKDAGRLGDLGVRPQNIPEPGEPTDELQHQLHNRKVQVARIAVDRRGRRTSFSAVFGRSQ